MKKYFIGLLGGLLSFNVFAIDIPNVDANVFLFRNYDDWKLVYNDISTKEKRIQAFNNITANYMPFKFLVGTADELSPIYYTSDELYVLDVNDDFSNPNVTIQEISEKYLRNGFINEIETEYLDPDIPADLPGVASYADWRELYLRIIDPKNATDDEFLKRIYITAKQILTWPWSIYQMTNSNKPGGMLWEGDSGFFDKETQKNIQEYFSNLRKKLESEKKKQQNEIRNSLLGLQSQLQRSSIDFNYNILEHLRIQPEDRVWLKGVGQIGASKNSLLKEQMYGFIMGADIYHSEDNENLTQMGLYLKAGKINTFATNMNVKENVVSLGLYSQAQYQTNFGLLSARGFLGGSKHFQSWNTNVKNTQLSPWSLDGGLEFGVNYKVNTHWDLSPTVLYEFTTQHQYTKSIEVSKEYSMDQYQMSLQRLGAHIAVAYQLNENIKLITNMGYNYLYIMNQDIDRMQKANTSNKLLSSKKDHQFDFGLSVKGKITQEQNISFDIKYTYWKNIDLHGLHFSLNYGYRF